MVFLQGEHKKTLSASKTEESPRPQSKGFNPDKHIVILSCFVSSIQGRPLVEFIAAFTWIFNLFLTKKKLWDTLWMTKSTFSYVLVYVSSSPRFSIWLILLHRVVRNVTAWPKLSSIRVLLKTIVGRSNIYVFSTAQGFQISARSLYLSMNMPTLLIIPELYKYTLLTFSVSFRPGTAVEFFYVL